MNRYAFPLCIQLTMPSSLDDPAFLKTLEQLNALGYYGVELNITDFETIRPDGLRRLLDQYHLKMTMLATGAYAQKEKLSLGSSDEAVRKRSVTAMRHTLIPFAEDMGCDIICGFIKGDTRAEGPQLRQSVDEINQYAGNSLSKIYLEATNHYESAVINTLEEGRGFVSGHPWQILPDTYHMNIEETGMAAALNAHRTLYHNIHLSDNNRYYPGFGAIDFYQILLLLKSMDFQGTMAIEGRNRGTLHEDIEASSRYLEEISQRIR